MLIQQLFAFEWCHRLQCLCISSTSLNAPFKRFYVHNRTKEIFETFFSSLTQKRKHSKKVRALESNPRPSGWPCCPHVTHSRAQNSTGRFKAHLSEVHPVGLFPVVGGGVALLHLPDTTTASFLPGSLDRGRKSLDSLHRWGLLHDGETLVR